ncbi:MAG TPA: DoxX family protein [Candidatus Limnocylindria bacterium]|nr:DoxX family protein [Candidatus Limnocylindria bacterium]
MSWVALLFLRFVTGSLLVGHGAQKLFGAFGGKGIEGTGESFRKLGLEPAQEWARVAGAAEIAGGGLTALGLLSPIGPIITTAPMIVAWRKQHGDKPIWINQGGAELPLTNLTIATALIVAGPGPVSIDHVLGIRTPWWLSLLAIIATATGIAIALGDDIHETAEAMRREAAAERAVTEELPAAVR